MQDIRPDRAGSSCTEVQPIDALACADNQMMEVVVINAHSQHRELPTSRSVAIGCVEDCPKRGVTGHTPRIALAFGRECEHALEQTCCKRPAGVCAGS
jgi:hypothetical protein